MSELFSEVAAACKRHGIAESAFGRAAVKDPRLVSELRSGRTLRPATEARIRAYIAQLDAKGTENG